MQRYKIKNTLQISSAGLFPFKKGNFIDVRMILLILWDIVDQIALVFNPLWDLKYVDKGIPKRYTWIILDGLNYINVPDKVLCKFK